MWCYTRTSGLCRGAILVICFSNATSTGTQTHVLLFDMPECYGVGRRGGGRGELLEGVRAYPWPAFQHVFTHTHVFYSSSLVCVLVLNTSNTVCLYVNHTWVLSLDRKSELELSVPSSKLQGPSGCVVATVVAGPTQLYDYNTYLRKQYFSRKGLICSLYIANIYLTPLDQ